MAAWDHLFDLDQLEPTQPFEVDRQAAHLFKHPYLSIDDVIEVCIPIHCSTRPGRQHTG